MSPAIGIGGSISIPPKNSFVSLLSHIPKEVLTLLALVWSLALEFSNTCSLRRPSILTVVWFVIVVIWSFPSFASKDNSVIGALHITSSFALLNVLLKK